jgi:hypothetical protein
MVLSGEPEERIIICRESQCCYLSNFTEGNRYLTRRNKIRLSAQRGSIGLDSKVTMLKERASADILVRI